MVKAEKLYPDELETIKHRFDMIRKGLENEYNLRKLQYLLELDKAKALQLFPSLEAEFYQRYADLEADFQLILQTNRPTVLAQETSQKLQEIQQRIFTFNEKELPLLTPFELSRLSIVKGSLDQEERLNS